jgi:hypothetical protein
MATASTTTPSLRLTRSAQSGLKAMSAVMTAVFLDSSTAAWLFQGAIVDLSPMQAGDTISVRVRTQLALGSGYANEHIMSYSGAQPTNHVQIKIPPIPNTYGVEIAMQQTAGVLRDIQCDFYAAKRAGM